MKVAAAAATVYALHTKSLKWKTVRTFNESARGRRPSLRYTVVSSCRCFGSPYIFFSFFFCIALPFAHCGANNFTLNELIVCVFFVDIFSSTRCTIDIRTDCSVVRCIGQSEGEIASPDHRSSGSAWGRQQSGQNHWPKFRVGFLVDHTQRCAGAGAKYSIVEQSNCTAFPTKQYGRCGGNINQGIKFTGRRDCFRSIFRIASHLGGHLPWRFKGCTRMGRGQCRKITSTEQLTGIQITSNRIFASELLLLAPHATNFKLKLVPF